MAERSGYSSAQIMAMQRDAIRRVNEMQRISQEKLRQTEAAFGGRIDQAQGAPPAAGQRDAPPPAPSLPSELPSQPVQEGGGAGGMGNDSYGVNRRGPTNGQNPNAVPVHHAGGGSGSAFRPEPAHPPEEPPPEPPQAETPPGGVLPEEAGPAELVPASGLQGILQRMNLDSETVVLLMLLLLLVNEGADVTLIMALVYILL